MKNHKIMGLFAAVLVIIGMLSPVSADAESMHEQVGREDNVDFLPFLENAAAREELLNLRPEMRSDIPPAKGRTQQGSAQGYSDADLPLEAESGQETDSLSFYQDEFTQPAEYKIDLGETKESLFPNTYEAYFNVVTKCKEQYGETSLTEGPSSGMKRFIGLSFLDLIDFDHNGTEELVLGFYVDFIGYIFNVWGYDGQRAILLQDGVSFYGGNGGNQLVRIINNANGTYLLRGSVESFDYRYYYGYAGSWYGLVKFIGYDCGDGYGGYYMPVTGEFVEDGKNISEEEYVELMRLWEINPGYIHESYSLTPFDDDQVDKTMRKIKSTMEILNACNDSNETESTSIR